MDVKEKLIEILRKPIFPHELVDPTEAVADYLLDSGVTVQEWISVKDRLPITNVGVLVYTPRLKNIFEVFYKLDGKWEIFSYRGGEILNDEVTHWMPLPEPPKEDDDGC